MTVPSVNSMFCFPSILNVPRGVATMRVPVKQNSDCFPWGQSLSAYTTAHEKLYVTSFKITLQLVSNSAGKTVDKFQTNAQ